ncbi:hypothetical protein NZD88_01540 [Chryseobacterium antibioticum]|uniref:C1q domain-containing protein n=1 Tax=Chryseobacterium pyrolae TaxID=2987481 RepID=A0ABT2ID49_9FLAO|nr:hypothetical protein [Chryseobacterium pyrolae]MCT2406237.1 hypothetical protein [Chryseobacterium pyrolae]
MKKTFISIVLLVAASTQAQVGINTETPNATLDVQGKASTTTIPDGIITPRISKQQLAAKTDATYTPAQTAAIVYVNDITAPTGTVPSLIEVAEVTAIGYYYFNGSMWKAISGGAATVDKSIYAGDGDLSSNRTVNQLGKTLAFNGGTTANAFSVNGSSLSVDALNDRVGIGTTAPLTKLHVVAQAMQGNRYNLIDAPSSTNQYALLALRNTSPLATGNYSLLGFTNDGPTSGGANWGIGSIRTGASSTTGSEEDFYVGNSLGGSLIERFRINSSGNIGIGTSLPQRILHVNANANPVRFENLPILPASTASSGLVIDANGDIYKNNTSGATVDTSIYAGDGALSTNRTVTQSGNKLAFNGYTGTATDAFSVDGSTLSVDAVNNRVGIGTNAPLRQFHVANTTVGSPDIRFENLPALPANVPSTGVVIDANGDVYKNNTTSVEGQILRIGLNARTYTSSGDQPIRFDANNSAAEMGNAPNAAPNFINTIVGATIAEGVNAIAGAGTPARTTDQISLQPGVYKIQLRLVASMSSSSVFSLKAVVNNNEYTLVQGANNSSNSSVYYLDDLINITGTTPQTVDFLVGPPTFGNLVIASSAGAGGGNSYRSIIMIQRLR